MLTSPSTVAAATNVILFPVGNPPGDLFVGPSSTMAGNDIVGLVVKIVHRPCRACNCAAFVIGSSAAMHHARLTCTECGAFTGWMSRGAFTFIQMTIDKFGRPTEPIIVRHSTLESGGDGDA